MPSKPRRPNDQLTLRNADRDRRIERAIELLLDHEDPKSSAEVVAILMNEAKALNPDGISRRTAYNNVGEAWRRVAAITADTKEALLARADQAWQRREAIADKKGDSQAGNYALDRWTKLHGLYAPKKVELSGSVSIGIQIRGIVGVLDERGIEALGIVMEQIERARQAGLLAEVGTDAPALPAPEEEPARPSRPAAKKR